MAHHKRRRAKNQRAGCLLCKPHKANHADRRTIQEMRLDGSIRRSFRSNRFDAVG